LHWFGLFVSPSLRTSQDHFKSGKTSLFMIGMNIYTNVLLKIAAEQLIHQVNRIQELESMERRYNELQEEKLAIKLKEATSLTEDVLA
jgi:hypothetical protein